MTSSQLASRNNQAIQRRRFWVTQAPNAFMEANTAAQVAAKASKLHLPGRFRQAFQPVTFRHEFTRVHYFERFVAAAFRLPDEPVIGTAAVVTHEHQFAETAPAVEPAHRPEHFRICTQKAVAHTGTFSEQQLRWELRLPEVRSNCTVRQQPFGFECSEPRLG